MSTLPARPPISAPVQEGGGSLALGLRGLWLVVPIAALLAVGAGGPEESVLILGPLVTYALPLLVMVAFWWEDWPGTRLGPNWSGWADTALIAAGGVVLASPVSGSRVASTSAGCSTRRRAPGTCRRSRRRCRWRGRCSS